MLAVPCFECELCGLILKDKTQMEKHEVCRQVPYTIGQTVYHHHTELCYGEDIGLTYEVRITEVTPFRHGWLYKTDWKPCTCPTNEWWIEEDLQPEQY